MNEHASRLLQLRGERDAAVSDLLEKQKEGGGRVVEVQVFNDVIHGVQRLFHDVVSEVTSCPPHPTPRLPALSSPTLPPPRARRGALHCRQGWLAT